MNRGDEGVGIAKTLKVIEELKLKVIQSMADIYTAIHNGAENQIQQKAAKIIVYMYSLNKNSGYSYRSLDKEVVKQAEIMKQEEKEEYLNELTQYLKMRGE
ncbi:MazG-like family protein [Proteinivorax tanatarense]|uniref:MazG-like family protein n=1 Tax=Proteinivorax tanatarense TaxID=1260629 RepID=A0AAU7VLI4_9FIRM